MTSVISSVSWLNSSAWCTDCGPVDIDTDRLVADLPPVAVGAVQHAGAPVLPQPLDRRQLVDHTGGDDEPPGHEPGTVLQDDREAVLDMLGRDGSALAQLAAVVRQLDATRRDQVRGPIPSRDRKLCTPSAGALRGSPASITSTERRDLASAIPALSPAAPPPMTITSWSMSMTLLLSVGSCAPRHHRSAEPI